ncbi:MAG: BrnA antitoxin family protein [Gammaproteobacteria bacterium]|nr:BrnA antitoxin family protein [Gammaproteobacteria bacterium]
MRGSKTTSMTLDEMRAACERGESKTDRVRVRRNARMGIEPASDRDSPDASRHMRQLLKRGRPKLDKPKELLTLRVDPDTIKKWKATGPGWQTRMAAVLKAVV